MKFVNTKVFTVIETEEDSRQLLEDLDKLYQWSEVRQMAYKIDKCKVMHI